MAQQLKALVALAEDPHSIPTNYKVVSWDPMPSLASVGTRHTRDAHRHMQANIHTHNEEKCFALFLRRKSLGCREDQWLRALRALSKVLSSIPSNHMVAHNHL